MAAKAYVLMQTEARRVEEIVLDAAHIPGVRAAEAIHGSYDVLVTAEDETEADITRHITRPLGTIDGVIRTTTCFVVPAQ